MREVPFYPCNPYNQPCKEVKPRPISLVTFPSPPNSPGTFHTPPTSPSTAVSARKRHAHCPARKLIKNALYQHFPGKWHQRPALKRVKEACFKRCSRQNSRKLGFNLVGVGCQCSLLDCPSPKLTSSSWLSSVTPAPYSQGRWSNFLWYHLG